MAIAETFRNLMDKLLNRERALPPLEEHSDDQLENEAQLAEPVAQLAPRVKGKGLGAGFTNIDLTPPFFREAVQARELKKRWIFINAGVLTVIALAGSSLYVASLPTHYALSSQEQSNQQLQAAIKKYQPESQASGDDSNAQVKLNQAAGNAVNWETLISAVEAALPSGTSISSFGINASGSTDKGASLLIAFQADSPLGYADTLKAVQSARGVSNVQIGGMSSSGDNSYTFSATFDYDSSIKTNRFPSTNGGN